MNIRSERYDILGVMINTINMPQALEAIATWITARQPNYMEIIYALLPRTG